MTAPDSFCAFNKKKEKKKGADYDSISGKCRLG